MGCPPVDPSVIDAAKAARKVEVYSDMFVEWGKVDVALSAARDARKLRDFVGRYWVSRAFGSP
jgi:hypothetical protein